MCDNDSTRDEIRKALVELFSGYRAEWLAGKLFSLFTEPAYFPQLVTPHPCFLVGGRGTGKTTALKCLSYEGLNALQQSEDVSAWPYYGMYYRVNTNRVKAFHGMELNDERWRKWFAHYINLELCELVLRFLEWYAERKPNAPRIDEESLRRLATALNLSPVNTHEALTQALQLSRLQFEASINNIGDNTALPLLSMQGVPVDQLMKDVHRLPQFDGKSFFFLIDEYENFDNLQQRVVNTLIKHCGELYSFKIGVREFGLRERRTVRDTESLTHPADFKRIDVVDELLQDGRFETFAAQVCNLRLSQAFGGAKPAPTG